MRDRRQRNQQKPNSIRRIVVNEAFELTDSQRERCLASGGYFFRSCVQHFGVLVTEHGYRMSFHDMGQGCDLVRFMQDIQTEYFAVRIFHEFDALWCDIHRFAGTDHQNRLRLADACLPLGILCPSQRLDTSLPMEQTVPQRVREFADCIRALLTEFHSLPVDAKPNA